MAKYRITWSRKHDSGIQTEHSPIAAHLWIIKLRKWGARTLILEVELDGKMIDEKRLEVLAAHETKILCLESGRANAGNPASDDRDGERNGTYKDETATSDGHHDGSRNDAAGAT